MKNKDQIPWVYFKKPHEWVKHNLTVIADWTCPDSGQRYHLVKENIGSGKMIDNAQVYSERPA